MDGVFDLFHVGHLEAIQKCKSFGHHVCIGVISDEDCRSYKRNPIIPGDHRAEIVKNIKDVDEVIYPAPLVLTLDFINKHSIDKVVHAFKDNDDFKKQYIFFKELIDAGKFIRIDYCDKVSTTDIIRKIK